jgi:hypothetical protein
LKKPPNTMLLTDYVKLVDPTDKMPPDLAPVLFGLFGEVGSIMAASKKHHREGDVYVGFRDAVVEEFGDALWYVTAIARRLKLPIDDIFSAAVTQSGHQTTVAANDLAGWPLALAKRAVPTPELDPALLKLGDATAALLPIANDQSQARSLLTKFSAFYLEALQASGMSFAEIADHNARKTRGRFLAPDPNELPRFDREFEDEERIPKHFEILVTQRKSGKSYLQWNGVFLGDPLTDNIADPDGYRFHDVFHLAHAAVLHWSPVFRALIKQKRKSDPRYDETEDGGRAIVVEEGVTAWIFAQAKHMGFFAGSESVSFDLLKVVQKFVAGYEVERCPLKLWEDAILQGYRAFLQLRENEGGLLIGDRDSRTLTYKPR